MHNYEIIVSNNININRFVKIRICRLAEQKLVAEVFNRMLIDIRHMESAV